MELFAIGRSVIRRSTYGQLRTFLSPAAVRRQIAATKFWMRAEHVRTILHLKHFQMRPVISAPVPKIYGEICPTRFFAYEALIYVPKHAEF